MLVSIEAGTLLYTDSLGETDTFETCVICDNSESILLSSLKYICPNIPAYGYMYIRTC